MSDTLPDALRHADTAQESIRSMTRVMPNVLTAPIASDVLGELMAMSHLLPEAFIKIGLGLTRALSEFETYENDGSDPEISVVTARAFLEHAADLARQMGEALDGAQTAISEQGHKSPEWSGS